MSFINRFENKTKKYFTFIFIVVLKKSLQISVKYSNLITVLKTSITVTLS